MFHQFLPNYELINMFHQFLPNYELINMFHQFPLIMN